MNPEKKAEGFDALTELALDLRWSWNHASDEVWRALDPMLWHLTRHPDTVLQAVSRAEVERRLAEPALRAKVDALVQTKRDEAATAGWFQQKHPQAPLGAVAYFSLEFMLSEWRNVDLAGGRRAGGGPASRGDR